MNNLLKELKVRGELVQTIVGDSMEPMLHSRTSLVKIRSTKEKLKPMDIPLYQRPDGKMVLHRILSVKDTCYIICGDNRYNREIVPFSWVHGVVTAYYNGNWEDLSNPDYLRYLETLPKQRKKLWLKSIPKRIMRRLKRTIP